MKIICYLRSLLVPVTMPLAFIASMPVLLITRSRRRAINFCTGLWADMTCTLIGLKVEITGAEHLTSIRPAVFVLNHQSNADGFLVAKLIRRDIAFLGKSELSRQRIRSRLMRWAGLVLVDRENAADAGSAMQALTNTIRKEGRSTAIFPEGTRSHSTTLGQFKKGAFLMALRARAPIIPIVIHNSIDSQPRGEAIYRPATVKIDVLPPVDTSTWRVKTLDSHIAALRDSYLQVLGQQDERRSQDRLLI
jgi:putative phosphoserine phosphatase/1-acylglycerol-3-phosphate O-acyltransferase